MIELTKRSVLVEYVLLLYFSAEASLSIYTSIHACLYSTRKPCARYLFNKYAC